MSLVNDMLRDLEKRERLPENAGRVAGVMSADLEESTGVPWLLLVMVLVGVVFGVGGGYWYSQKASAPVAVVDDNVQVEPAILATPVETEFVLSPVVITAKVQHENIHAEGFEISFVISEKIPFEIVSRSAYGINLHLPGVTALNSGRINVDGVNLYSSEDGFNVLIELAQDAQFKVYERTGTEGYSVVVEAAWEAAVQELVQQAAAEPQVLVKPAAELVVKVDDHLSPAQNRVPVRTERVLSLDDQDKNTSLKAVKQMQQGQFSAAYARLNEFISAYPEAHQSRQTLATLLLAQGDSSKASLVVDEGLALAPNYSAYKKIKARLLMDNEQLAEAIILLEHLPPQIEKDVEYYELQAALYQQLGRHQDSIKTYQDLLRHDRQQGKYWVGMAVSLEANGSIQDAISSFQAGLQTSTLESALRQYSQNRVSSLGQQL